MPTYVYRFIDTGETIEVHQSFDDEPLREAPHPSDGKPRPVKKVFTPVGITFKGGGFYKTDSSGSSSGAAPSSGPTSSAGSSGSDSSGSSASSSSTSGSSTSGSSTSSSATSGSGD
jgi:predicted nucleic acid-binding Zn ribbon protein